MPLLVVLGAMIPAAAASTTLVNTKSFLQCAYDAGSGGPDDDDPQRAPCVDGAFQMIKDLKVLLKDPEQFASTASGKDSTLHDSVSTPPQSSTLPSVCVCVCMCVCDSPIPYIPTHAQQRAHPLGHLGLEGSKSREASEALLRW